MASVALVTLADRGIAMPESALRTHNGVFTETVTECCVLLLSVAVAIAVVVVVAAVV